MSNKDAFRVLLEILVVLYFLGAAWLIYGKRLIDIKLTDGRVVSIFLAIGFVLTLLLVRAMPLQ